jgi:Fe-S-cluster formation regulator IscX/YfhJ
VAGPLRRDGLAPGENAPPDVDPLRVRFTAQRDPIV